MGYNSWYDVYMSPSEAHVRATLAAMQQYGLPALGYKYVNLDDGIVEVNRDGNGNLVPDSKGFPNGFKSLADYIHSQGLLFGVYTDRGTQTCGGRAGAGGHEAQDAAFYAANDIDYVKEDSCNAAQDHATAFHEYSLMRDGLNATGKPIFFSLCGWETWYAPVGHSLGNSWRTGPDDTNWHGVLDDLDDIAPLWPYAGPGGWNDPCLLLGKDSNGNVDVTDPQGRAQFSMWAIVAAPMLLSQNILNWTTYQIQTYTNAEVIAVGQDKLGRAGQRLAGGTFLPSGDGNIPVTATPCQTSRLTGQAVSTQQWTYNSPQSGFLTNVANKQCMNVDDCGAGVITFPCVTSGGTCAGPTSYANEQFNFSTNGPVPQMTNAMQGQCITSQGVGNQVQLSGCVQSNTAQTWSYDAASMTINNGQGLCLSTAGALNNTANVWGRPLADGSWALVFMNAGETDVALTCDSACLSVTGWDATQLLLVRDLWAQSNVGNITVAQGLSVPDLAADGGVQMYKLTPIF